MRHVFASLFLSSTLVLFAYEKVELTTMPQEDFDAYLKSLGVPLEEKTPPKQDDVFLKVFGKKMNMPSQLTTGLFINGRLSNVELVVHFLADGALSKVEATPLIEQMQRWLTQDEISVFEMASKDGFLPVETLTAQGIEAVYDSQSLVLVINIPAEKRKKQSYRFINRSGVHGAEGTLTPAKLSGFVNTNYAQTYTHEKPSSARSGFFEPARVSLDGAINFADIVLEGAGIYQEKSTPLWQRESFRLIKDFPESMHRVQFGDLLQTGVAFQRQDATGGLGFAKNFQLQPDYVAYPVTDNDIYLNSDSQVKIFINGNEFNTLRLSAGSHNLADLPVQSGPNDIRLEITDISGNVRVVEVPFILHTKLLKQDTDEYGAFIGYLSTTSGGVMRYSWQEPQATTFYRKGVSAVCTLGQGVQLSKHQYLLSTEVAWARPFGAISANAGVSKIFRGFDGAAIDLAYTDFPKKGNYSDVSWSLRSTYYTKRFAQMGTLTADQPNWAVLAGSIGTMLPYNSSARLGVTYSLSRIVNTRDTHGYSLTLGKAWKNTWSTSVNTNWTYDTNGMMQRSTNFSLAASFPVQHQSLRYSNSFSSKLHSLDWSYSSPEPVQAFSTTASGQYRNLSDDPLYGTTSSVTYKGYRTLAQMSNVYSNATNTSGEDHSTRLNVSSSLVFADGIFGLSRPITDSFCVLSRDGEMELFPVGINGNRSGKYQAQIDYLGPAVIGEMQNYRVQTLSIDDSALPPGVQLHESYYSLRARYHSGFGIELRQSGNIMLRGKLLDENSEALPLVSGQLTSSHTPPILFFSNRAGRMQATGLTAGTYTFTINPSPHGLFESFELTIPEGTKGLFDLGEIHVRKRTLETP